VSEPDPDEPDIRVVSVIWSEDDEPRLEFIGCSEHEAKGLLQGALTALERNFPVLLADEEVDEAT
jgi:hypothetical protein